MKRFLLALAIFMVAPLALLAQDAAPEIPFESVPNLLKLPPNMSLGEASGVAVNSRGHIFVFSRGNSTGPAYAASAAQLLEFGPDGTYIREIGHNLYAWSFAHTVRIDKQDNIWATDKGSDMVVKFNPQGQVVMLFGRKQEASDEGTAPLKHPRPPLPPVDGMFRQVTDVAWNAAADTYISDGYINSRVAKVDKNGRWLKSFGEPGAGPGQLSTPHSIATDAQGNVYVANRGNARIEVFDGDGNYVRQIKINEPFDYANALPAIGNKPGPDATGTMGPGAPWAVCITPGPNQVLYAADAFPGRVYKISLDGKVLGVLGRSGKQLKEFGWIHEIACPSENTIFVAELLNWRVQKLILHPKKATKQNKARGRNGDARRGVNEQQAAGLPLKPALSASWAERAFFLLCRDPVSGAFCDLADLVPMRELRSERRTGITARIEVLWIDESGSPRFISGNLEDKSHCGASIRVEEAIRVGSKLVAQWEGGQFSGRVMYCLRAGEEFVLGVHRGSANGADQK